MTDESNNGSNYESYYLSILINRYTLIDYFSSLLESFFYEKHPELSGDTQLLKQRSRKALCTYQELYDKGISPNNALEAACLEMTGGFGFSLYQFLYDLIFDDFKEIPDEKRRDFCLSILPECQKTYNNLSFDGMEDWEAYYLLEEKMVEIIQIFEVDFTNKLSTNENISM